MNQENKMPGVGRLMLGFLLGVLLALISPLVLLTEVFSLLPVIMIPAIGLVLLYHWCGRAPAVLSGMLMLVVTARMLGSTFMWMLFFAVILPTVLLLGLAKKPFFTRLKLSIAAFSAGVVLAVVVLYFGYGGNMIERTLAKLPETMRSLPVEAVRIPMQNLSAALGYELTIEKFYQMFDEIISSTTPVYQMNLPGLIFSGALSTAIVCAGFSGYMTGKGEAAPEDAWVPLRKWALPSSTTGGMLLMMATGYILQALNVQYSQAVYYAVYNVVIIAFSVQTLGSMARYLHNSHLKRFPQRAILAVIAVLSMLGASYYVAIYGCASAVFGRHGALRQRMEEMKNNHHPDEK